MTNDLTIVTDNWLEVANGLKDLPAPFQQEIFLLKCSVAGTTHVADIASKTKDLAEGDMLSLLRDPENKYDPLAIGVYTAKKERVGWVPQRQNAVISRLMDAGKLLYAKISFKELVKGRTWVDIRMKIYMRDV